MSTTPTNLEVRNLALGLHTDLTTINTYADKAPTVTLPLLIEAEKKMLTISSYITEVRAAAVDLLRAQASAALGLPDHPITLDPAA